MRTGSPCRADAPGCGPLTNSGPSHWELIDHHLDPGRGAPRPGAAPPPPPPPPSTPLHTPTHTPSHTPTPRSASRSPSPARSHRRSPSPARSDSVAKPCAQTRAPGEAAVPLLPTPWGPRRAHPAAGELPGREGLSPPSSRLPRVAAAGAGARGAGARGRRAGDRMRMPGVLPVPAPATPAPARPLPARTDAGRPDARSGEWASERGPPPGRAARPPPTARGIRAPVAAGGPPPDPDCPRLSRDRCRPAPADLSPATPPGPPRSPEPWRARGSRRASPEPALGPGCLLPPAPQGADTNFCS